MAEGQFLLRDSIKNIMRFDIVTIFPKVFSGYFDESIIKRAQRKKLVRIKIWDLRGFAKDKHKTVDDRPYGGGFGMVLMVEPIYRAIKEIQKRSRAKKKKIILLSAKGKKFNQKMAREFSKLDQLIIISGHYEGVDERVAKHIIDEEISLGDFVLTGGEVPAMALVDAITRLLPGVISKGSLEDESFSKSVGYKEAPHYTRPEEIEINGKKRRVPRVLVSGNHKKIEEWRKKNQKSS